MPSLSYRRYTRLKAEQGILSPADAWTLKHRRHCFSHRSDWGSWLMWGVDLPYQPRGIGWVTPPSSDCHPRQWGSCLILCITVGIQTEFLPAEGGIALSNGNRNNLLHYDGGF